MTGTIASYSISAPGLFSSLLAVSDKIIIYIDAEENQAGLEFDAVVIATLNNGKNLSKSFKIYIG